MPSISLTGSGKAPPFINSIWHKGLLTYAGLLMFGKAPFVLRYVPTFCVDYIEIPAPTIQQAEVLVSASHPDKRISRVAKIHRFRLYFGNVESK